MQLNQFNSSEQLDQKLSEKIICLLNDAINARGLASLVVSGGKTPISLFKQLSQMPLDWANVTITLADERWVETNGNASNEKLVRDNLLQNNAAKATFVPLKSHAKTAKEGALIAKKRLNAIPRPFDVVILGMGEDGHTASLFPGAENLKNGLDMTSDATVVEMVPLTAPSERLTMTLPTLLNSRNIFIHLVGDSKLTVLENALQTTDIAEMPIRAFLQQQTVPVTVFWSS